MEKNIVLKIAGRKGVFSQPYEYGEYEDAAVVIAKNKVSALRRLARRTGEENIIVACPDASLSVFENKIKEYRDISEEVIIAVIEKICRQSAKKFSMPVPFGEIYIAAPHHFAYCIINALCGLSRLFTVVSPYEITGRMYDELYFKQGTIIRHIPYFNNDIRDDAIIIRCDGEEMNYPPNTVLIDFCRQTAQGKNILNAREVYIYDESISPVQGLWGGNSGAALYTLTGKIPDKEAVLDIDRKADKIFLLDTEVF